MAELNSRQQAASVSSPDLLPASVGGEFFAVSMETLAAYVAQQNPIDLSTKQDVLTPGLNITIDSNNVISAMGGGDATNAVLITNVNQSIDGIKDFTSLRSRGVGVVETGNDQTINGIKTFNNTAIFSAGLEGNRPFLVDGSEVLTQATLEIAPLAKKPESFDIVSGIANGVNAQTLVTGEIFGFPAASRYATLNVDIVWQALESHVITLDNLTRFLITGRDDSTNLEISNQTGLLGVRYAAATQHESLAFIFDSETNRDAFVTLGQTIFGTSLSPTSNSFRFQLDYEVENDLGGFADITNALYCRNGADVLGTTTTDILRSRGCVELFNRASDIYTPNATGTSRGNNNRRHHRQQLWRRYWSVIHYRRHRPIYNHRWELHLL